MKAFKPPSPPPRGGAGWAEVLRWLSGRLSDWQFRRELGKCFKRLKRGQHDIAGFPRFYLITKCGGLGELNPDWKRIAYLFHLHHAGIDADDHLVIHFMRWLRD
jgi:hypothetical protein